MEVTKWLEPSISVSRIGDSAIVQAATRVNAEQSSKSRSRPKTFASSSHNPMLSAFRAASGYRIPHLSVRREALHI
jgi:hypothetical protein